MWIIVSLQTSVIGVSADDEIAPVAVEARISAGNAIGCGNVLRDCSRGFEAILDIAVLPQQIVRGDLPCGCQSHSFRGRCQFQLSRIEPQPVEYQSQSGHGDDKCERHDRDSDAPTCLSGQKGLSERLHGEMTLAIVNQANDSPTATHRRP
jgi:hypothetical protein